MFHIRISQSMRRPLEAMTAHLATLSTLDTLCTLTLIGSWAASGHATWWHTSLFVCAVTTLLSFGVVMCFRERADPWMFGALVLQLSVRYAAACRLYRATSFSDSQPAPGAAVATSADGELMHSCWLVPALLMAQAFGSTALHVHVQLLAIFRPGGPGPSPLAFLALALAVRSVLFGLITLNTLSLELLTISSHALARAYELCALSTRLLAFTLFTLAFRDGSFALVNDALLSSVILRLLLRRQGCSWAAWGEEYSRVLFGTLVPAWQHYGGFVETTVSNVVLSAWLSVCEALAV
jgi:hypothetical protein